MKRDEVRAAVRKQPFQPFLVHVLDGRRFEVRHPELVDVDENAMVVHTPPDSTGNQQVQTIPLFHVTRLEPLTPAGRGPEKP